MMKRPRIGKYGAGLLLPLICGWVVPGKAVSGGESQAVTGARARDLEVTQVPGSRDTLWRIEQEPTLVLGLSEGRDEYLFFHIRGATRLSTGNIVVLNGGTRELRAFSPSGRHLWTAGGPGDGPGEMRAPSYLERLPGDLLQVQDVVSRIRYAPDGTLADHDRLAIEDLVKFGRYFVAECPVPGFVGDQVLACTSSGDVAQLPGEAGPWRRESRLVLLPWQLDSIIPLGVFLVEDAWALPLVRPAGVTVRALTGAMGYASPPMSRRGVFAIGGWPRKLVAAETGGDLVFAFDLVQGRALPSVAIRNVRRPPTTAELAGAWKAVAGSARLRNMYRPEYLEEHLPTPDSIPNLDDLVVDDLGMVWVGLYQGVASAPRWYNVYGPGGLFAARVAMPAGVEVLEIGADYVLGVIRDALDVERIALLTLVRG